ncbi:MAG: acetoin utilization protein AcuC [Gemmatimonadota bacterium]
MNAALIWDPSFASYTFRPDHPFNATRLELTVSLIQEMGLLGDDGSRIVAPRMASDEELRRVHSAEFIEAVKRLGSADVDCSDAARWGLGSEDTPFFPGMHEAAASVVGGTLRAAELVMSGEVQRAFAIAGGLHHAHRDRASGFCIYNDLAAAIAWIREQYGLRVMYIDYDGHHGDGVQGIFYADPGVLTISIHESGRYLFPATGFVDELGEGDGYGYSLNLPVEPQTEDDSWISIYTALLNEVSEAFRPEVIVIQNGCDAHVLDHLTHLRCTTRLYEETIRVTGEIADRFCSGRIVATGGGGYDIWRVVPRAWTLVWAGLTDQSPPDRIPQHWLDRWQGLSPCLLPERLRDQDGEFPEVPRRAEIESLNRRALEALRRTALPVLRGWSLGF